MDLKSPSAVETVTATTTLSGPDWELQVRLEVPTGPTSLRHLLPMAQSLADAVVGGAVQTVEGRGEKISCKKGCGACCRQLVPIAEVEARHVRDVVDRLPEPRRSEVRTRFAEARRRLQEADLLEPLEQRGQWIEGARQAIGIAYFQQGIACPFLEEGSCSIYHDRPIACREYLVTSPAENCSRPTAETVRCVKMPLTVWTALAKFDNALPGRRSLRWVPLILAPQWGEANPEESPPRPGPELLRELFDHLTGKSIKNLPVHPPFDSPPSPAGERPLAE